MSIDPYAPHFRPEPDGPHLERYRVDGALGVLALIRELVASNALFALYAPNDHESFAISRIISLSRERIVVDLNTSASRAGEILRDGPILAVGFLERVKVQFTLEPTDRIAQDGSTHVVCRAPSRAYRIQRREAYRVFPPSQHEISIVLRIGDGVEAEMPLLNLSVGGASVGWSTAHKEPRVGQHFEHCRIEAGAEGAIPCTISVRQVGELVETDARAKTGQRQVGLVFEALPPPVERRIQRLVNELERAILRAR